jgi:hypothetical protein
MADAARQVDPLNLRFHEGRWIMKVSTLQRVCDVVFVPKTYSIEGTDSILSCLRDQEDQGELLVATEEIFANAALDPPPEYRPEKGRWVPRHPQINAAPMPAPAPAEEQELDSEEVEELHERIRLLEDRLHQLEDLEQRLERLEAVSQSPPPQELPPVDEPKDSPPGPDDMAQDGGNPPPHS